MSIIFFLKYASALKGVNDNYQRTVNITKLKPAVNLTMTNMVNMTNYSLSLFNLTVCIKILNKGYDDVVRRNRNNSTRSSVKNLADHFHYYVTNKNRDGSFFVVENIDSTNWIEWYVKKEPILGNKLYPSGIYSWELIGDDENGTVSLYDETRSAYSILSSEGWFVQFPENSDFWLYNKGSWSANRPAEIANGTNCASVVNV